MGRPVLALPGELRHGDRRIRPNGFFGDLPAFTIRGSHSYSKAGTYPITIIVKDFGGKSATLKATAIVTDAGNPGGPGTGTHPSPSGTQGLVNPVNFTVDTVTYAIEGVTLDYPDPKSLAGDFLFLVNWGDGTQDQGTLVETGRSAAGTTFDVHFPTHTYPRSAISEVHVTLTDIKAGKVYPWG